METLDAADGFDLHEYRHGLKLVTQDRDSAALRNEAGFACPACGRTFARLFVSSSPEVTFNSAPDGPICLVRTDEEMLVLTH